jgi:hypothetical protein
MSDQLIRRAGTAEVVATGMAPTAVLVWHGMGQQVPFETIEIVAKVLAQDEHRRTGRAPIVTPRRVEFGGAKLWRVELELTGKAKSHPVHVYEAYWAPLMEGKITLGEIVKALISAGIDGVRYGLVPPRVLTRFLFGQWVTFPLRASLALTYLLLLLAVLSLVIINTTIVATASLQLLGYFTSRAWAPSDALVQDLTIDLAGLALAFAASGSGLGAAWAEHRAKRRGATAARRRPVAQSLLWIVTALNLVAIVIVGALVTWHLIAGGTSVTQRRSWSLPPWLAMAIWAAVMAGSATIRAFLLQFVGDSVIYIASHRLNRFYEARQDVKNMSTAFAKAIYKFGGYQRHIIVGHSLGSVIAYDTLNALINDDISTTEKLEVTRRTSLFLTFGSVLDKIAFLFRVQSPSSDIREVLAAAVQPLISVAVARPKWVNIHSPNDVLGGSLEYYDPQHGCGTSSAARPIENVLDRDAWIPLLAHNQFWTNTPFVNTLFEAVIEP